MEEGPKRGGSAPHVLAIPYPTQGHVFPLLWFSRRLVLCGATVTFLAYEDTIRQITLQQTPDEDNVYGRSLHFKAMPKTERPDMWRSPFERSLSLREDFESNLKKYVEDKNEGRDLPTCIVSDMFLMWTQDVANQLNIPRYNMIPSGATLAVITGDFLRLHEKGEFEYSKKDGRLIKNNKGYSVPGLPHLSYHEIPFTAMTNTAAFVARSRTTWQAAGVLVNTFIGLEDEIIKTFEGLTPPEEFGAGKKVPKLYPVGPMRSTSADFAVSVTSDQAQQSSPDGCLAWLSSQPRSSVLYVAFGTVVSVSPENIQELAHALEASEQRFLWVLRGSSSDSLPEGFEARVSERGCVVRGWAPQVAILAHPSTAAFFTHCGWNSSIESILMGVPMIGWPGGAEQHLNCRDLMDRLKIVEQIQTGPENILRRAEALRSIRLVMIEDEGKLIKERVKRLQKLLAEATGEGGSQSRVIQSFVDDIRKMA